MPKEKESVIPEVIEAYKVLAEYSFDSEITSQDKNRVLELLSKVPKKSDHYDKLEIVIAALNIGVLTKEGLYFPAKPAARALKEYMIDCGVDPGEIMNLHLESRDAYRRGHGGCVYRLNKKIGARQNAVFLYCLPHSFGTSYNNFYALEVRIHSLQSFGYIPFILLSVIKRNVA